MNPTARAILSNPEPRGHIVYPYTGEAQVAEAVSLFASVGLWRGEGIILVMASTHCAPIRQRLAEHGFDLAALEGSGQLVCQDAQDLLSSFYSNGIIDGLKFKTEIGSIIETAKSRSGNRSVRVFGEMVDIIWTSNPMATQRLEELWNEVIEEHSVPLLCAYSLAGSRPGDFPAPLKACHSHSIA